MQPTEVFTKNPFYESLQVPLARPWLDERESEAARAVVSSGMLCQGAKTAAFEDAFAEKIEAGHAVAVGSGSEALLVSLQAMGVRAGDEVIVPDMTFISTATAAMYLGARPVIADITLTDYNLEIDGIERHITEKTKAFIPVHYAGQTADMGPLKKIAAQNGFQILEDAAEAHLARYEGGGFAGTIGDAGIFSFTPTKLMTTGEGGMIVTNDEAIAQECRLIRNFGDRGKFDWGELGFNFRMTDIAAAIGLCQLAKLDEIVAARKVKAKKYNAAFEGVEAIVTPWARTAEDINYQLYTIRLRTEQLRIDRDEFMAHLAERGVASRLYYPALHRMEVFKNTGQALDDDKFPNAVAFEDSALSLPIFTGLTETEQDQVIEAVIETAQSAAL